MKRTKIIDVLKSTEYGKEVCVKGWVRTHRSSKAVDFIALNDGSTIKNVQIVVDPTKFDEQVLKDITTGACINAEGIQLEDGEIKADAIEYASDTDKKQVGIEIHSGKNRIVRRIFESLGYKVVKLDRVQFAGLTKKNVKRGDWRYLTEEEVDRLRMGAYE